MSDCRVDEGIHTSACEHVAAPGIVGTPTVQLVDDTPMPDNRAAMTSKWDKDANDLPPEVAAKRPINEILSACKNPAEAVKALQDEGYTHSEVKTFIESIDDETFDGMLSQEGGEEPAWLEAFEPDTQLSHNGWECRILTVQPVPDGRRLVLIEPLCTTPEARAKYRKVLERRGFSKKKIHQMTKEIFPGEEPA